MDTSIFTLNDLLQRISGVIADSLDAVDLSKLSSEDRRIFLEGITARSMNTFWRTYVEFLPTQVRQEFETAISKDQPAVTEWYATYANFMEDEHARSLADAILGQMGEDFPAQIADDFSAFKYANQYA